MMLQNVLYFLPVVMHTTAAIVAMHATASRIARLRTKLFDGTLSIVIRFLSTAKITTTFLRATVSNRQLRRSGPKKYLFLKTYSLGVFGTEGIFSFYRKCTEKRPFFYFSGGWGLYACTLGAIGNVLISEMIFNQPK